MSGSERMKAMCVGLREAASKMDDASAQRLIQSVTDWESAFEQLSPEALRVLDEQVRETMAREAVFEDWRREQAQSVSTY